MLRAIAVSFVLVFHWAPHALERVGPLGARFEHSTALWSGVDLFFCVSGFVITASLLRASSGTALRAGFVRFALPFWTRRMWRLWPSAWLWIAISVALAYWFNSTGIFGTPPNTTIDGLMAWANLYNIHAFYCIHDQSCGSLSVYWSLSLEEQFYFVFPVLVFFLPRRMLVLVLLAAAMLQLAMPRPPQFDAAAPSLLWLVRTDAICYGALIAMWQGSVSYWQMRPARLAGAPVSVPVLASLLCMLAVAPAPALGFQHATGLVAIVSGVLVWIASYGSAFTFPIIGPLEPLLSWLGARSYSLYLIHEVGGRLSVQLRAHVPATAGSAIPGMLLTIALTVCLSELNYRFVEAPLRRIGRDKAVRDNPAIALTRHAAPAAEELRPRSLLLPPR